MSQTPQALADQTLLTITNTLNRDIEGENVLTALQIHYETLHKSQQMYIDYLTEFIAKLKETQQRDTSSLSTLKKEVLRHILDMEKTKKHV